MDLNNESYPDQPTEEEQIYSELTAKQTIALNEWIPELYTDPDDETVLLLCFESLNQRVIIPFDTRLEITDLMIDRFKQFFLDLQEIYDGDGADPSSP